MPILIEIIFFLVLGATGVWTYIKNTTKTITHGVKEKLQERERNKNISEYPIYRYANQFTEPEKYTLFGLLIILINGDTTSNGLPNIRKTKLLNTLASVFEINLSIAEEGASMLNQYVVVKDLKRSETILGVSIFVLFQMALVDGDFTDSEFGFIEYLSNVLNLTQLDLENIVMTWGKKLNN
jgi:hypothetical protein